MPDLYQTLGVQRGASDDEIKQAYRKLAREHHPDKGGDADKFQAIEEAYRILKDAAKRGQYDKTGSTKRQADPQQKARNMVATLFSQLLKANDFAERDYVSMLKQCIEQNERKQHSDKRKCKAFVDRVGKLIDVTKGEVLLGVLNQRLQVAQGQIADADATLETIKHAQDMLKGCKCGADVEECLAIGHGDAIRRFVFESQCR